jgi:hypothetical protein
MLIQSYVYYTPLYLVLEVSCGGVCGTTTEVQDCSPVDFKLLQDLLQPGFNSAKCRFCGLYSVRIGGVAL